MTLALLQHCGTLLCLHMQAPTHTPDEKEQRYGAPSEIIGGSGVASGTQQRSGPSSGWQSFPGPHQCLKLLHHMFV